MKPLLFMVLMTAFIFAGDFNGSCAETVGANLLPNPGFEEGDKLPKGWTTWNDGTCCTFVWDKTAAHGGQRSLYLCNSDKEGSMAWITTCNLKAETSYRFSAWIKISKAKDSRGAALIRVRGNTKGAVKHWEKTSEAKADTGNQWQQIQWDFKTPAGLERADFWLWSINGKGDQVWFDDVELKEIKE